MGDASDPESLATGSSILDLGAGVRSLVDELQARKIAFRSYLGLEGFSPFLKTAREKFRGQRHIRFFQADIFDESMRWKSRLSEQKFDYVIASGVFSARPLTWSAEAYNGMALRFLDRFAQLSDWGLAFNFCPDERMYDPSRERRSLGIRTHVMERMEVVVSLAQRGYDLKTRPGLMRHFFVQTPLLMIPPRGITS